MNDFAAIVLAAGKGTRFNKGRPSTKAKVLYEVEGKKMILFGLEALRRVGVEEIVIVVGYLGEEVKNFLGSEYNYAVQEKPLGTGDATSAGLKQIQKDVRNVIVLYGADIYSEQTIQEALKVHTNQNPILTFVTMKLENPTGFGRIIRGKNGQVEAIVEEKVATDSQRKIIEVNDGCYIFKRSWLEESIKSLEISKANEYFLTDLVEVAIKENSKIATYNVTKPESWIGIDSLEDLRQAEKTLRGKKK